MIDLLSLGPLLQAAPVVSTDSSASAAQEFSALLTELVGALPQQSSVPNLPIRLESLPSTPLRNNSGAPQKLKTPTQDGSAQTAQVGGEALTPGPAIPLSVAAFPQAAPLATKPAEVSSPEPPAPADKPTPVAPTLPQLPQPFLDALEKAGIKIEPEAAAKQAEVANDTAATAESNVPEASAGLQLPRPLLDALEKAGIKVQPQTSKPGQAQPVSSPNQAIVTAVALEHLLQGSAAPSTSASETPEASADGGVHFAPGDIKKFEITIRHEPVPAAVQPALLPRQAAATTDPLESIRQLQFPPRVMAIQKGAFEGKPPNRKNESAPDSSDSGTLVPAFQSADPERTTDAVEQPRPPQHVQIPDVPKLQVVRTVSMEVGDADSQVTIRIEDRDGGLRLHIGTGSDTMHRTLEASVDSLVQSLKQEKIELSNVQISRKSPIEKVRRMKEAH